MGEVTIPAHRYILACRSEYFRKIFTTKSEDLALLPGMTPTISIDNTNFEIFTQMLKFIYTDTCDLLTIGGTFKLSSKNGVKQGTSLLPDENGDVIEIEVNRKISAFEVYEKKRKKKGGKKTEDGAQKKDNVDQKPSQNPVRLLMDMAKKFGVKNLVKRYVKLYACLGLFQLIGSEGGVM